VIHGWHGTRFDSPLTRTREYVEVVRAIVARRDRVSYAGRFYPLPLPGTDSPPLKSSLKPFRERIPLLLASNGPQAVAQTARIADGWLPAFFSPDRPDLYRELLAPGLAKRDPALGPLRIVATAYIAAGDDPAACRDRLRPAFALYLGGMGSRGHNVYADIVTRLGHGAAARRIQDLYLNGRKDSAAAAVPDALIDELALVGPVERIAERLAAWRDSGVDVITLKTGDIALCRQLMQRW
jgi:F420-dependent oxidoreductase-like protein